MLTLRTINQEHVLSRAAGHSQRPVALGPRKALDDQPNLNRELRPRRIGTENGTQPPSSLPSVATCSHTARQRSDTMLTYATRPPRLLILSHPHPHKVARETLDVFKNPGWKGVGASVLHPRSSDTTQELSLITAVLLAIGARRSTHSVITGSAVRIDNPTPDQLVQLDYGRRREAACQTLAARAIDMARNSGALSKDGKRSAEIHSLLRIMTFTVVPQDPYFLELAADMRRKRTHQDSDADRNWVASAVACDALSAVLFRRPLGVSDRKLAKLGWEDGRGVRAQAVLRAARNDPGAVSMPVMDALRKSGLATLRATAAIQALPSSTSMETVLEQFRVLWDTLDLQLATSLKIATSPGSAS